MEQDRYKYRSAVVTGASSGIGFAISKMLCELGVTVYGIGRDFDRPEVADLIKNDGNFTAIELDLMNTDLLCRTVKDILSESDISILVNNAGVGYYGLHEELNPKKIQEMVRINLEVPMILTQQLLRGLKKNSGYIFNISSVTAGKSNTHGCAYGATKAGLTSFGKSLFDEARKYGVKVITIHPDMTQTNLYRNADFCEGVEEESYLVPEEVAEVVKFVLEQREGMVVSEMTLQPQIHRIRKK